MPLIDQLDVLLGSDGAEQVQQWRSHLKQIVDRERQRERLRELEEHRSRNERFE